MELYVWVQFPLIKPNRKTERRPAVINEKLPKSTHLRVNVGTLKLPRQIGVGFVSQVWFLAVP